MTLIFLPSKVIIGEPMDHPTIGSALSDDQLRKFGIQTPRLPVVR